MGQQGKANRFQGPVMPLSWYSELCFLLSTGSCRPPMQAEAICWRGSLESRVMLVCF